MQRLWQKNIRLLPSDTCITLSEPAAFCANKNGILMPASSNKNIQSGMYVTFKF